MLRHEEINAKINGHRGGQGAERMAKADAAVSRKPNGHAKEQVQGASHEPVAGIDWASLEGKAPPAREFVVDGWLPIGCATSLYGKGGVGKSLLAQILGGCVAGGRPFLGLKTMQAPVLGVFCEDDDTELWRRQQRINGFVNLRMADLTAFTAQGRLGMSNMLMTFPKGRPPMALPLLAEIEEKAREIGAKLVILDNAAQMFGGDEINRAEVTAFINALNGMARRLGAAVLLLGHPPKSGAEYSGSTAWHSVVRCMWTIAPIAEKDEDGETGDALVLTRHKANYAPIGEEIRLRWVDGVLRRDEGEAPMSAGDAAFHRHNAKGAFLAALDTLTAQRRNVSHSERAPNYAPKAMKAAGLAEGYTKGDLRRAMNDLFAEDTIVGDAPLWLKPNRHHASGIARRGSTWAHPGAEHHDAAPPDDDACAPGFADLDAHLDAHSGARGDAGRAAHV
jgi:RecA-family ATPase